MLESFHGALFGLLTIFVLPTALARAEVCAKSYSELQKTSRLQSLEPILPASGRRGFVNKTEGSYLYLEEINGHFEILFLTTGFFDLFAISRAGKVEFCDTGKTLTIKGLEQTRIITPLGTGFKFGEGQPNEIFHPGEIPEALRKKHED